MNQNHDAPLVWFSAVEAALLEGTVFGAGAADLGDGGGGDGAVEWRLRPRLTNWRTTDSRKHSPIDGAHITWTHNRVRLKPPTRAPKTPRSRLDPRPQFPQACPQPPQAADRPSSIQVVCVLLKGASKKTRHKSATRSSAHSTSPARSGE